MAVANVTTLSTVHECFMRPTDLCFFCGEPLAGVTWIYWNGVDEKQQQIWLHRDCAKKLADSLNLDFHKR